MACIRVVSANQLVRVGSKDRLVKKIERLHIKRVDHLPCRQMRQQVLT